MVRYPTEKKITPILVSIPVVDREKRRAGSPELKYYREGELSKVMRWLRENKILIKLFCIIP